MPDPPFWPHLEVVHVKTILARFTVALSLLATMALALGAGVKWY